MIGLTISGNITGNVIINQSARRALRYQAKIPSKHFAKLEEVVTLAEQSRKKNAAVDNLLAAPHSIKPKLGQAPRTTRKAITLTEQTRQADSTTNKLGTPLQ
ncbi:hypothetical protein ACMFMG_010532 [Clarireedia jacksonii]